MQLKERNFAFVVYAAEKKGMIFVEIFYHFLKGVWDF